MNRSSSGGRDIVVRWRILAAQRLDHLTELHETGRWKLYHREQAFLDMMKEAHEALTAWTRLAPPDPALDRIIEIELTQNADGEGGLHGSLPGEHSLADVLLPDGVCPDHDLREA